jgi:uncharacterized protein
VNDAESLWVLLGNRHGDNRQLLAIADALNRPYRAVQLRFKRGARLAPARWFAHRLTWRSELPLEPPWPRAVLAAGRKCVPAALWIRRESRGRTRLIHVNRPWAPLAWFDLVVTTPQYALPERPNVLTNLLPFVPPPLPVPLPASREALAASLPRPWTAVLVGGNSRPFVLDDATAALLAAKVNAEVRESGGSAWVLDSPRTPASAMETLARGLEVPAQMVRWGSGENCYAALLGLADRFIVTADSASMLTEALLSGRPVTPFALPAEADWRWRLGAAWRAAAERSPQSLTRRALDAMVGLGLLASVRDLGLLQRALQQAGMFGGAGQPRELAERERQRTVARINEVIARP